jgi:hypothetical protein
MHPYCQKAAAAKHRLCGIQPMAIAQSVVGFRSPNGRTRIIRAAELDTGPLASVADFSDSEAMQAEAISRTRRPRTLAGCVLIA